MIVSILLSTVIFGGVMKNKPLVDLLHDLEQEMLRLGYTDGSMLFYRGRWKKLLKFSKEKNQVFYSEQLGLDFLEKYFRIFEKDFDRTLSQSETQEIRVMRMIGDFQLHHSILRRFRSSIKKLSTPTSNNL